MTAPDSSASKLQDLNLAEWAAQNGRKLAWGAGIAVVSAAAVWLFITSSRRKEAFASQELLKARSSAEAGNLPLAASDLSRLVDRFRGTRSADEAVIMLNQIRLVQGQRDVAVPALKDFVRGRHDNDIAASAYGLLGAGLEDQGTMREAGEAYREAASRARHDFLKAQYLLDAGRAFTAAADSTSAKNVFGEVLNRFGRLDQAAEARVRMAELGGVVPPAPAPEDSTRG